MRQLCWEQPIVQNDVEMMLHAYQESKGKPWTELQWYKTCNKFSIELSKCIQNTEDLFIHMGEE